MEASRYISDAIRVFVAVISLGGGRCGRGVVEPLVCGDDNVEPDRLMFAVLTLSWGSSLPSTPPSLMAHSAALCNVVFITCYD